ncbi:MULTISPECIES: hypothetical protein [Pseudescherichia]|uniref:hypothetical protein n=1 Tax=Pseudescherichia TaxID=2055880 RepID=UPI00301C2E01
MKEQLAAMTIIELVTTAHGYATSIQQIDTHSAIVREMASRLEALNLAHIGGMNSLRSAISDRDQLAAENAYLLPRAASELSNAWVLHKYLIGIQAAIMYLDNGNKNAAQEWLYGTIAGPGFEFPDEVDDIDAWATHQMRGSISHPRALEIIKEETPATDAFLREQQAKGVEMFAEVCSTANNGHEIHPDIEEIKAFAAQLRAGEAV